jgi:hypothetical protein
MKTLIRKILREQFEYKQQLFDLLRTGDKNNIEMVKMISQGQDIDVIELLIEFFKENPKPPYFKILKHFDLSKDVMNYILSGIFVEPVKYSHNVILDENGNNIYMEDSEGYWSRREFDDNGNDIYYENSDGDWYRKKYKKNGKLKYYEDSTGYIRDNR